MLMITKEQFFFRTTCQQEISSKEITLPSKGTTMTTAHDKPPLTEPKIINISSRDLMENKIRLLKRGLKFTPTPPRNTTELKADIHEFSQKLRLAEYFNDKEQNIDNSLAKNKSNFVPPRSEDDHLALFLNDLSKLEQQSQKKTRKCNISTAEQKALQDLKHDNTIIIKQADKGGATVVMDKSYYRDKMLHLLSDTENYIQLPKNEDKAIL